MSATGRRCIGSSSCSYPETYQTGTGTLRLTYAKVRFFPESGGGIADFPIRSGFLREISWSVGGKLLPCHSSRKRRIFRHKLPGVARGPAVSAPPAAETGPSRAAAVPLPREKNFIARKNLTLPRSRSPAAPGKKFIARKNLTLPRSRSPAAPGKKFNARKNLTTLLILLL